MRLRYPLSTQTVNSLIRRSCDLHLSFMSGCDLAFFETGVYKKTELLGAGQTSPTKLSMFAAQYQRRMGVSHVLFLEQ